LKKYRVIIKAEYEIKADSEREAIEKAICEDIDNPNRTYKAVIK